MKSSVQTAIADAVIVGDVEEVIRIVAAEYEFDCPSFVYAGPGHQSRHDCDNTRPHSLEGEHNDWAYEWYGTSVMKDGKLLFNTKHTGNGDCGH